MTQPESIYSLGYRLALSFKQTCGPLDACMLCIYIYIWNLKSELDRSIYVFGTRKHQRIKWVALIEKQCTLVLFLNKKSWEKKFKRRKSVKPFDPASSVHVFLSHAHLINTVFSCELCCFLPDALCVLVPLSESALPDAPWPLFYITPMRAFQSWGYTHWSNAGHHYIYNIIWQKDKVQKRVFCNYHKAKGESFIASHGPLGFTFTGCMHDKESFQILKTLRRQPPKSIYLAPAWLIALCGRGEGCILVKHATPQNK